MLFFSPAGKWIPNTHSLIRLWRGGGAEQIVSKRQEVGGWGLLITLVNTTFFSETQTSKKKMERTSTECLLYPRVRPKVSELRVRVAPAQISGKEQQIRRSRKEVPSLDYKDGQLPPGRRCHTGVHEYCVRWARKVHPAPDEEMFLQTVFDRFFTKCFYPVILLFFFFSSRNFSCSLGP